MTAPAQDPRALAAKVHGIVANTDVWIDRRPLLASLASALDAALDAKEKAERERDEARREADAAYAILDEIPCCDSPARIACDSTCDLNLWLGHYREAKEARAFAAAGAGKEKP